MRHAAVGIIVTLLIIVLLAGAIGFALVLLILLSAPFGVYYF